MIVKCTFCESLMRVDHERLGTRNKVKVRCPHCQNVGLVGGRPLAYESAKSKRKSSGSSGILSHVPEKVATRNEPTGEALPESEDEYLFPSEQKDFSYSRSTEGKGIHIFLWIMASLIVILLFAMLVNFVLPGPPR
jgi:predicted Zn finger-like uncharacterized protein